MRSFSIVHTLWVSVCVVFAILTISIPHSTAQEENSISLKTVDTLQLSAYGGQWFVMYASASVKDPLFIDGFCAVQLHENISPYTQAAVAFDITIFQNINSPYDELVSEEDFTASNTAFGSNPGKFDLFSDDSTTATSTHWILAVGPVNPDSGLYEWAIVSDSLGKGVTLLGRDVVGFQQQYEEEVVQRAKDLGFVGVDREPVKIFQSATECDYPM